MRYVPSSMNIVNATSLLIDYYKDKDTFCLDKDFQSLVGVVESPERNKAAVICALENMEANQVISSSEVDGVKYWVLERAFSTLKQNLELEPMTALLISKLINSLGEVMGNEQLLSDPTNIKSKDIDNLCTITRMLIDEKG